MCSKEKKESRLFEQLHLVCFEQGVHIRDNIYTPCFEAFKSLAGRSPLVCHRLERLPADLLGTSSQALEGCHRPGPLPAQQDMALRSVGVR